MEAQSAAARAVLVRLAQELDHMSSDPGPIADLELQIQCIRAVSGELDSDRDFTNNIEEQAAIEMAGNLAQTLGMALDRILNPRGK